MQRHFDVLIVGAGSAGSVIASRLSEDAGCTVGLVESGTMPADPDIADPLKWPTIQNRSYDWAYRTVPQRHTAGRIHEWPRGRIVGGSSCLHAMAYVRGHRSDFDAWEEAGGERWGYDGLLAGFRISEKRVPSRGSQAGPLDAWLPDAEVSPVVRAYMAAGNAMGVPRIASHNGGELIGTTPNTLNIRAGRRLSVADAYLPPDVVARRNLVLLTGFDVERVEFAGDRAVALLALQSGNAERLTADRFVLCGGAVGSPLLLMRSGIGPADALAKAGLDCRLDRQEVGANLQDHLLALGNVYAARQPVPPSRLQHSESLMYLDSTNLRAASGKPDIVLACVVAPSVSEVLSAPPYGTAFTLLCGVTHPTSRGRITPSGPGSKDLPIIDPQYLSTEHDRMTFRKALRIARKVGGHAALADWREREILPGADVRSDAELDAFIAKAASTHHHPAGTCRMGKDAGAVVDPDLRVNGTDNVFVVDASILPTLPSGPINAAVVAIAEMWARSA